MWVRRLPPWVDVNILILYIFLLFASCLCLSLFLLFCLSYNHSKDKKKRVTKPRMRTYTTYRTPLERTTRLARSRSPTKISCTPNFLGGHSGACVLRPSVFTRSANQFAPAPAAPSGCAQSTFLSCFCIRLKKRVYWLRAERRSRVKVVCANSFDNSDPARLSS